ncbi:hypothetical protein Tsubulata_000653 [Turnera subulata]|uniref:uridine/cytidine kinase n=1 Tax=Turnera subulata TaxID=218843 RepID=A0A9Q0J7N5_9ROSI|nr:hypothetical protein Tsubulata_000653 [Turnera subulata]
MPEATDSIDYVMEKASGPHFSGLRLDGLLSSPPSSASGSPAHRSASASASASFDANSPKQPFVIGVSGGTASGKTTVCDMIIQQLHDHRVVLVNQDSFYRGLTPEESERVHEYNFDHPDAFDTEQLLDCVEKLRSGQSYHVPIYDFKNHRRSSDSFRQVNASDVIILEGILVFHDQRVRNLMNMKIFVDTDADVRLARRIRRDTVERGRDINSVLEQFIGSNYSVYCPFDSITFNFLLLSFSLYLLHLESIRYADCALPRQLLIVQYAKFVKPAFDDFVLPSKKYADVIIPRGGDNHVAIDLIVQHIRTKLGQHDLCKVYPNVYVIQSTFQIRGMHTLIRDKEISKHDFVFYSDRLIRLVVEHGLGHLPFTEKQVVTPTGSVYTGVDFCKKLCGVSIVRSGESMENALRACCKGIKIGKILIHRDGDNGKQLIYEKLPKDISERHVLLLDPVLATGNSANQAIELLIHKGVPESHIIFLNLISAPEGIHCVCKRFPSLKIVTSEIDVALNEEFRVIPDFGSGASVFAMEAADDGEGEDDDGDPDAPRLVLLRDFRKFLVLYECKVSFSTRIGLCIERNSCHLNCFGSVDQVIRLIAQDLYHGVQLRLLGLDIIRSIPARREVPTSKFHRRFHQMPLCLPSYPLITCRVSPSAVRPPPPSKRSPPPPSPPLPVVNLNQTATASSLACALQCPHFQSCSGCTQELNLHRPTIVDEADAFFKSIGVSDFTFDSCRLWGWRCRAKLAVRGSSGSPLIGLYQEGTHDVVDIPECKAHHPNINAAVELLRKGISALNVEPYDEDEGTGELRYVQMAVTTYNTSLPAAERYKNGQVQVSLVWNSRNEKTPSCDKLKALASFLWRNGGPRSDVRLIHSVWANFQTSTNNIIFGNRWRHLLGETDFWEHVGGIDLSLAPSSFGQANTRAFDILLRKLQKYVPYGASVADLYAGAGVIGLSLAATRKCRQILSFLNFPGLCFINPLSWLMGSEVVVVDPPRKGLDASLIGALWSISSLERKTTSSESSNSNIKEEKRPWVLRAREASVQVGSRENLKGPQSLPQTLIYISCGWESFKQDCRALLSSKEWRLEKAHGFNFFPGTQSIEVLAIFKRGARAALKKKKTGKKKKRL